MSSTAFGLSIVLAAGAIGSATLMPMKFVRKWQWENSWLVFATFAYLALPLLMAFLTVPGLGSVYASADPVTIAKVSLFGLGWGISVVMLGLAVAAAGLAVANAVILGCSISLGSLVPMAIYHREKLFSADGGRLIAANVLLLLGVMLCAVAGHLRDRRATHNTDLAKPRGGGLALCFLAGILTPLLNFALAAGAPITQLAIASGASDRDAANAVWGLAVGAGSLPSIMYCAAILSRNRTWGNYTSTSTAWNFCLSLVMGVLFIVSTIGYGFGAVKMGSLGPAIGWPVYVSSLLIGNACWGWWTGEWQEAPRRAVVAMIIGIALQIAGILFMFMVGTT